MLCERAKEFGSIRFEQGNRQRLLVLKNCDTRSITQTLMLLKVSRKDMGKIVFPDFSKLIRVKIGRVQKQFATLVTVAMLRFHRFYCILVALAHPRMARQGEVIPRKGSERRRKLNK